MRRPTPASGDGRHALRRLRRRASWWRADDVVALPERLSFEQGAAIPVNYSTAWAGLVRYGSLQAGERVLIHAAAGGVGIAAIQIARRYGAEVHGTASPGKHDALRALGVDVADRLRTSGGLPTFDLIMDAIGGPLVPALLRPARPAGGWSRSAPRR